MDVKLADSCPQCSVQGALCEHHLRIECSEQRERIEELERRLTIGDEEISELRKLCRPWIDAQGVYHRHNGTDYPSADACPWCKLAELERENEQQRADVAKATLCADDGVEYPWPFLVERVDAYRECIARLEKLRREE